MLGDIFYWVLNLSILGSAAGLVVVLLRRIRALPRFCVYLLWTLPLTRLWIPFGLANKYSLLSFISRYTTKTVIVREHLPSLTVSNFVQAAESYFPVTYKTDPLKGIFEVAGTIWAVIASAAILCSVLMYIFTKSALRDKDHIKDNIYRSDKILSPAVYGIINPQIFLPPGIDRGNLKHILTHERIHIRRMDNLWRMIAVITACTHWFNPLVWLCLRCFFIDMELSCDSAALKNLNKSEQKEYASALLACSAGKTRYASAFGGAKTRLRIENILSYKKLTLLSGLCFGALFAAVTITIMTNAVGG